MPMLRVCAHPDCGTRTLGEFCLEHEEPPVKPAAADVVRDLHAVAASSASASATYAEAETER